LSSSQSSAAAVAVAVLKASEMIKNDDKNSIEEEYNNRSDEKYNDRIDGKYENNFEQKLESSSSDDGSSHDSITDEFINTKRMSNTMPTSPSKKLQQYLRSNQPNKSKEKDDKSFSVQELRFKDQVDRHHYHDDDEIIESMEEATDCYVTDERDAPTSFFDERMDDEQRSIIDEDEENDLILEHYTKSDERSREYHRHHDSSSSYSDNTYESSTLLSYQYYNEHNNGNCMNYQSTELRNPFPSFTHALVTLYAQTKTSIQNFMESDAYHHMRNGCIICTRHTNYFICTTLPNQCKTFVQNSDALQKCAPTTSLYSCTVASPNSKKGKKKRQNNDAENEGVATAMMVQGLPNIKDSKEDGRKGRRSKSRSKSCRSKSRSKSRPNRGTGAGVENDDDGSRKKAHDNTATVASDV